MTPLPKLRAHHLAELRASGLSDATITAAGIHTEDDYLALAAALDWSKYPRKMAPALVFPYVNADGTNGYLRVKPDTPRKLKGKAVKYESRRGCGNQIYIPPGVAKLLERADAELLLTEGEKKALKGTQEGFPTVGLVGVFGWKDGRRERLLPALERIVWQDRTVFIGFDSDIERNVEVQSAESRLAKQLVDRGAIVRCVRLPDGPPDEDGQPTKMGLDDFLVAHGPVAFRKLLDSALEPDKVQGPDGKEDAGKIDPGDEAKAILRSLERDGVCQLRFWNGGWWHWSAGAYREREVAEVRASVLRHLDHGYRNLSSGAVSCVIDHLKAHAILSNQIEPGQWLAPSLYNWPAGEVLVTRSQLVHLLSLIEGKPNAVLPATPRLFSTAALDFDFDVDAPKPEVWAEFLFRLWRDDQATVDALQEWIGYLLTCDTSQQKIALLVGPARSGKGTIGRVIRGLVGKHNVAGPTLASLATHFGLSPLVGKSVAIISDARLSGRTDSAVVLERLLSISGEDALDIDRKFLPALTTKLPTRIVILSNELPRLADSSGALASRFIIFRMRESFLGREDVSLFDRLKPELPAILLWALAGWKRLHDRGHFLQPDGGKELVDEMADLTSPIGAFVREECKVDAGREVRRADLYAAYREWAEAKGRSHIEDEVLFGRGLRAAVAKVGDTQHRDNTGKLHRYYTGISLA